MPLEPAEIRELDQIREGMESLHAKFDSMLKTISTDFVGRLAAAERDVVGVAGAVETHVIQIKSDVAQASKRAEEQVTAAKLEMASHIATFKEHAKAVLSTDENSIASRLARAESIVGSHKLLIAVLSTLLTPLVIAELLHLFGLTH